MTADAPRPPALRLLVRGAVALTAAAAAVSTVLLAPPAAAAPVAAADAPAPRTTVTADALPTVQIDGIVWAQVTVGDIVYVAGSFTTARPAGSAAGTNEVPRENLLAYDIRTGELVESFHHVLNAEAVAIAASPDGSRVYVGGKFTSVDGVGRYRLAAFDTATGALVTGFKPIPNAAVSTVAVTADSVYFGGTFGNVNGVARTRAAAVNASGALLPWAPTVDNYGINTMVVTPDSTGVVLGGRFSTVNKQAALGTAAVDAVTGATRPWALNQVIKGSNTAGALTLSTDGTLIYGGNYTFGNGNFEGSWAADPSTGAIVWANDCLGDTYSVFPVNGVLYTTGHAHNCAAMGGFPETNPRTLNYALAFDTTASDRYNTPDAYGNNFSAYRTTPLLQWFPTLTRGSYQGTNQAAWSVTGNADYVAYGGVFPGVNNAPQQGLVRFAAHPLAPNAYGPAALGAASTTVGDNGAGGATVGVTARGAYDRDDATLRYDLYRSGVVDPVASTTATVTGFWTTQANVTLVDPSAPRNASLTYKLVATDPGGKRSSQSVTVSTAVPAWVAQAGAVSSSGNGYQAAVGTTTLATRTLTVPFTATGNWFLPRPDGSCLKSGATTVTPDSMNLSTSQWGRYVGTFTYTLPASGTYGFQYGCRGDFSTPTIGVATLPAN